MSFFPSFRFFCVQKYPALNLKNWIQLFFARDFYIHLILLSLSLLFLLLWTSFCSFFSLLPLLNFSFYFSLIPYHLLSLSTPPSLVQYSDASSHWFNFLATLIDFTHSFFSFPLPLIQHSLLRLSLTFLSCLKFILSSMNSSDLLLLKFF